MENSDPLTRSVAAISKHKALQNIRVFYRDINTMGGVKPDNNRDHLHPKWEKSNQQMYALWTDGSYKKTRLNKQERNYAFIDEKWQVSSTLSQQSTLKPV